MESIPIWKVIFLGAVQGATEFLPISSSAHLVIFQQWLHLSQQGDFLLAFDIALHFGTLLAVILFFYRELWVIFQAVLGRKISPSAFPELKDVTTANGRKLALFLVFGSIPAAVVGLALKGFFEMLFADVIPASLFLLVTGGILWMTKKFAKGAIDFDQIKQRQAWGVGLAQAVAILPGVSRSGSTITAGLFLGLRPDVAARFSFLLAIPVIGGAVLMEVPHFLRLASPMILPFVVGAVVSFVVGYASIRWLLKFVQTGKLYRFSWYCWGMGCFAFLLAIL